MFKNSLSVLIIGYSFFTASFSYANLYIKLQNDNVCKVKKYEVLQNNSRTYGLLLEMQGALS